jgi:hypothetical protein
MSARAVGASGVGVTATATETRTAKRGRDMFQQRLKFLEQTSKRQQPAGSEQPGKRQRTAATGLKAGARERIAQMQEKLRAEANAQLKSDEEFETLVVEQLKRITKGKVEPDLMAMRVAQFKYRTAMQSLVQKMQKIMKLGDLDTVGEETIDGMLTDEDFEGLQGAMHAASAEYMLAATGQFDQAERSYVLRLLEESWSSEKAAEMDADANFELLAAQIDAVFAQDCAEQCKKAPSDAMAIGQVLTREQRKAQQQRLREINQKRVQRQEAERQAKRQSEEADKREKQRKAREVLASSKSALDRLSAFLNVPVPQFVYKAFDHVSSSKFLATATAGALFIAVGLAVHAGITAMIGGSVSIPNTPIDVDVSAAEAAAVAPVEFPRPPNATLTDDPFDQLEQEFADSRPLLAYDSAVTVLQKGARASKMALLSIKQLLQRLTAGAQSAAIDAGAFGSEAEARAAYVQEIGNFTSRFSQNVDDALESGTDEALREAFNSEKYTFITQLRPLERASEFADFAGLTTFWEESLKPLRQTYLDVAGEYAGIHEEFADALKSVFNTNNAFFRRAPLAFKIFGLLRYARKAGPFGQWVYNNLADKPLALLAYFESSGMRSFVPYLDGIKQSLYTAIFAGHENWIGSLWNVANWIMYAPSVPYVLAKSGAGVYDFVAQKMRSLHAFYTGRAEDVDEDEARQMGAPSVELSGLRKLLDKIEEKRGLLADDDFSSETGRMKRMLAKFLGFSYRASSRLPYLFGANILISVLAAVLPYISAVFYSTLAVQAATGATLAGLALIFWRVKHIAEKPQKLTSMVASTLSDPRVVAITGSIFFVLLVFGGTRFVVDLLNTDDMSSITAILGSDATSDSVQTMSDYWRETSRLEDIAARGSALAQNVTQAGASFDASYEEFIGEIGRSEIFTTWFNAVAAE